MDAVKKIIRKILKEFLFENQDNIAYNIFIIGRFLSSLHKVNEQFFCEEEPVIENLASGLNKDTTLHIIKLKIEEALNKSSKAKGIESDSFYKHFSGKEEAYRDVLDMISKFEKDS